MKQRFFPDGPRPPSPPREGASFLEGPYACSHCRQSHAQWGRFRLSPESNLSFCTPECAAGYNAAMESAGRVERHAFIERLYGRRVTPVTQLTGVTRDEWLAVARRNLREEERTRVREEMRVKLKKG